MRKSIFLIFFLTVWLFSCGPDLDPQKYVIRSLVYSSFEEYTFQYSGSRLQKLTGTDSISVAFAYYKDSTSVKQYKLGKIVNQIQLVYSGKQLTKFKLRWQFARVWYKDSIQFNYNSSGLVSFVNKGATYQVTMRDGNLAGIKRGTGTLAYSYTCTHDQLTNPFQSFYWLDHFAIQSGATTILQPLAIARFFSKNNVSTATSLLLGVTETQRYFYNYLHGILPQSINYEIQTAKDKISDLVFVFDIQYEPRQVSISSP